jgi:hypothetical protein
MRLAVSLPAWLLSLAAAPALADPWIAPGDSSLRHDLELLADAGLVRAPLTAWPVSWAEVKRDVNRAPVDPWREAWLEAALARVRAATKGMGRAGTMTAEAAVAASAEPMALRRFGYTPREEGELSASVQYLGDRYAFRAEATAVVDADDGKTYRPDGSYVAMVLGNWMLSAGYIDRWWGPGWEGSLIYGTNARPIPSITIERNYSDVIDHPWLRWIGQWRFVTTMGQLEGDRDDAPHAKFYGARITWKPHRRLEIGLSRSAQWCGDGRPCGFDTFWDLFSGNDNDQPLEEQPGNQMAGYDLRWSLPWAPVAVYLQAIGEDEAGVLPSKYIGLGGVEAWGGFGDSSWRAHLEYADTACGFYESEPEFGCAYRNVIYSDGYQYYDRSIGHAIDGDSEQVAAGLAWVRGDGSSWGLAAQSARVNRGNANPVHSVSPVPLKIESADVEHRRALLGGELSISAGVERRDGEAAGLEEETVARGFIRWVRAFE